MRNVPMPLETINAMPETWNHKPDEIIDGAVFGSLKKIGKLLGTFFGPKDEAYKKIKHDLAVEFEKTNGDMTYVSERTVRDDVIISDRDINLDDVPMAPLPGIEMETRRQVIDAKYAQLQEYQEAMNRNRKNM